MVRSGRAHSTPGERARSRPGLWGYACENFAAPAFGVDSTARLNEGTRLEEGMDANPSPLHVVRRSVWRDRRNATHVVHASDCAAEVARRHDIRGGGTRYSA